MSLLEPDNTRRPEEPAPAPVPWTFPELPIITAPVPLSPPRTETEKYGGLFYLGIAGLVVVLALVTWFGISVYRLGDLWAEIYNLNDQTRTETERNEVALRLCRDPRLDDHQRFEMSLQRNLPDQARYALAESVSTAVVAYDPRTFALAVARSPNWPVWLRLLYTRLLTYSAAKQYGVPPDALEQLAAQPDAMTRIWAAAALLLLPEPPSGLSQQIEQAAKLPGVEGELSRRLLEALHAPADQRITILDSATQWLRQNHPDAARIWNDKSDQAPTPNDRPR